MVLKRFSTGCHLSRIGWSDSPAVENRLRASALPLLTRCSDSLSAELPGSTGDYEEHKISGEGDSWHSAHGIRAADRSKPGPNDPQTQSGAGHGEIDRRGCRKLSREFPVYPGTHTGPGQRVANSCRPEAVRLRIAQSCPPPLPDYGSITKRALPRESPRHPIK
jgi:hypothetical protein